MSYKEYKIKLSKGQIDSLKSAKRIGEEVKVRLSKGDLSGSTLVMLTERQIAKISKAKSEGVGLEIIFSKTQIKRQSQLGGAIPIAAIAQAAPALADASKAVQETFQKGIDAIDNQLDRGFEKNKLTGKYDRMADRNQRFAERKNDTQLAKRFNYIKQEFVKERGLNWDDNKIWEYVLTGGSISDLKKGEGLFLHKGKGLFPHGGGLFTNGKGSKKSSKKESTKGSKKKNKK